MAVYVVTWNLNKERSNYNEARTAFIAHIHRYEHVLDSALETVRWISTEESIDEINTFLRKKLDDNDRIFISRVRSGERQGWLDKAVWDWINSQT